MHYNGATSCLFVNGAEIIKFKAKDSEITPCPLCLGSIPKDWSVDNMKNIGLKDCVYEFSVDYDTIAVSDILDIHKYLMEKKQNSIKMFRSAKQMLISVIMFFSCDLSSVNLLKCVSVNNQKCKVRSEIVNVNSNKSIFFPFSIKKSKCSGSCNNINDPCAKLCFWCC